MPSSQPKPAELVSQLKATLVAGLDLNAATGVLHSIEDKFLVPSGLYLNGGLAPRAGPKAPFEIIGVVTRADGRDLSDRERKSVDAGLRTIASIAQFSMGPLKPADSPEFS
jgi:hypothetical protein